MEEEIQRRKGRHIIPLGRIDFANIVALLKETDILLKALLLGARYTMEAGFYREKLEKRGLEIMIPDRDDRVFINNVIYNEATVGVIKPESSARFYEIAGKYVDQGAECVILGCTEIGLLMQQQYTDIPLFDSTSIQSRAIARLVIG